MTQDEIIEMARQAGVRDDENIFEFSQYKYLERFVKLIAAKEQEAIIDLVAFYGGPVDLEAAIRARGEQA